MINGNLLESEVLSFSTYSAYIHIPFCRRRCYYCDFPISVLGNNANPNTSVAIDEYVAFLCREITLTKSLGKPLETVFFGGGTPSLLPVKHLETILIALNKQFGIANNAEISIEIDPGTFTKEKLLGYQQLGVNRVSLGVQAFQDELLQICGRSHSVNDIFESINLINQVGINNFSLDLISGLPQQTLAMWENSLDRAISIQPQHISCYDLVLESVTAFGKQYQPGIKPLPSDEETASMYKLASAKLQNAGYIHYEISNYAKLGYQCQHNRVYWENCPYYAFGMGAASYLQKVRFTRPHTRRQYYDWISNGCIIDELPLSKNDILLEHLMLGLRLTEGVNIQEILTIKKSEQQEIFTKIINCLQNYYQQGWVEFTDLIPWEQDKIFIEQLSTNARLKLSDPEGFLFSNTILSSLFEVLS